MELDAENDASVEQRGQDEACLSHWVDLSGRPGSFFARLMPAGSVSRIGWHLGGGEVEKNRADDAAPAGLYQVEAVVLPIFDDR
jgi:hypothetical protein